MIVLQILHYLIQALQALIFLLKNLKIYKVVCSQYVLMGNSVYVAPKCLIITIILSAIRKN